MKNTFPLFVSPVRFFASSIIVVALACSVGCSSSSEGEKAGEPPLTGEEQSALSTELCESRISTCIPLDEAAARRESCRAGKGLCQARVAQRLARHDGTRAFITCMKGRACGLDDRGNCECNKSDDACHREAGLGMPASPRRDAYVAACQAKLVECGQGTKSFVDDWCTPGDIGYEIFNDATYDALAPCFSKTCGENTIRNCLRTTRDQVAGETC